MSRKEKFGCFTVAPTDYRMTAKRYGFEWAVLVDRDNILPPYRLRDIGVDHLGDYCLLPLSPWARRNPNQYKFMVKYGRYNKNSYVFFRTREDAETVLSLYAIKHGTFE